MNLYSQLKHFNQMNGSLLKIIKMKFSSKFNKIQQVGFKTQNIINTNKLTFITEQQLKFENGKVLIYRSKKSLMTSLRRYLGYYISISSIGSLIYFNPFKYVFPAAIPILWVCEIILIKFMFKRYQWNQEIAHQIYLLQSGSTTQIHYADKKRRKLFAQPLYRTYYNTIFTDPIEKQKQQVMPNHNPFPLKIKDFQNPDFNWFWCKYFSNGDNYFLIPKNYEYIRKDVLVQIFKGKTIKNP